MAWDNQCRVQIRGWDAPQAHKTQAYLFQVDATYLSVAMKMYVAREGENPCASPEVRYVGPRLKCVRVFLCVGGVIRLVDVRNLFAGRGRERFLLGRGVACRFG